MVYEYNKKRIILILLAAMLFIIGLVYFMEKERAKYVESIIELEDNWTMYLNGKKICDYPRGRIGNLTFPRTKKGDIVELTRPLENYKIKNKSLCFYTWHSVVSVYLDEKLIYENGDAELKKNQMIGNVRHYIKFKEKNLEGKTLRLVLYAAENDAMNRLTGIALYDSTDMSIVWYDRSISLFVVSFFMLGAAISVIIFFVAIMFFNEFNLKGAILSLSYISVSMYSICVARCMEIFVLNPRIYNTLEYLSLYLIPIFGVGFMSEYAFKLKSKFDKWFYIISIFANIIFAVVSFILCEQNLLHYSNTLNIFYIITTVSIIAGIKVLRHYKNIEHTDFYRYAFYVLALGSFLSILVFKFLYVERINQIFGIWQWYMYVLTIGFFISLLFLSGGFIVEVEGILVRSNYAKTYEKLSYIDSLTELGNRRAFEREIEGLKDIKNFMILSFDINRLKYVNDNYGHSVGDELIKAFANVMEKFALPNSRLYRTGGDEFVSVVLNNVSEKNYQDYVENMNKEIPKIKNTVLRNNLEFSAGFATSLESEDIKTVLELSDSRMYEAKKKSYQERNI